MAPRVLLSRLSLVGATWQLLRVINSYMDVSVFLSTSCFGQCVLCFLALFEDFAVDLAVKLEAPDSKSFAFWWPLVSFREQASQVSVS